MNANRYRFCIAVGVSALMMSLPGGAPMAQSATAAAPPQSDATGSPSRQEEAATRRVADAVAVVGRMEAVPRMAQLLGQAKGVFIVPKYIRAALGVGAVGGAGVLSVRRPDGSWSDPAFYNLGGISVGAQAGAEGGPVVLVLNNDKAVSKFMQKTEFSLSADAGLTVVNWAKMAQGTAGAGDVVAWAGTKGLFGNVVAVGLNGIRYSQKANDAYYHQSAATQDVLDGKFKNPQADMLKEALAKASAKP